ncbi:shikimate kinase [Citricoccus sp. I39-566]|uniref:shikimate kinase n=1 Tax=Citricoccus sp. I39-566 TaxID=3073268 RepID=UPI00286B2775|nr:shikimate kinase [Citricoccus sp. I39-566]WMY77502.1 shikimate kinase [Citricoccus sp. I39-566]
MSPATSGAPRWSPGRRIVLVGPMGSGKSTLGTVLARRLGLQRLDADDLFVAQHGPIADYFSTRGEPAFRQAEEDVIGEVLSRAEPCVLSLGGGAVLSALTRDRLLLGSHVVYLTVDESAALERLDGGAGRPVLAGDPGRTWRRILAERHGLYREVSQWTVDTTGRKTTDLADQVIRLVHTAESASEDHRSVHP